MEGGGARKLLASSPAPAGILTGICSWLVDKFDQLLPPETRSETLHHWAHIGLTVVLPVSLVLLCLYRCCCGPIRPCACLRRCFCCCCSKPDEEEEVDPLEIDYLEALMKAPGRGGAMMPRGVFEGNTRGYFRDLRAKKDLPTHWY